MNDATVVGMGAQGLAPARKKNDPSTVICTRIIFFSSGSKPLWMGGMNKYKDIHIKIYGGTGNQTRDPCITSQMLYH